MNTIEQRQASALSGAPWSREAALPSSEPEIQETIHTSESWRQTKQGASFLGNFLQLFFWNSMFFFDTKTTSLGHLHEFVFAAWSGENYFQTIFHFFNVCGSQLVLDHLHSAVNQQVEGITLLQLIPIARFGVGLHKLSPFWERLVCWDSGYDMTPPSNPMRSLTSYKSHLEKTPHVAINEVIFHSSAVRPKRWPSSPCLKISSPFTKVTSLMNTKITERWIFWSKTREEEKDGRLLYDTQVNWYVHTDILDKKVLKTLEERHNTYVFVGNNMFTKKRFIIERKSIRINEEIYTHEYVDK